MFSNVDIEKQIEERTKNRDKGILIEPFEQKSLTPVGYDLRVGSRGFSWQKKEDIDIEITGNIEIEPNDTVVIETLESISLSREIGATIHSMTTRVVSQGLSHISTTIDPGWTGKLLICFHNYRDSCVELRFKDAFCTVCFYKVESESRMPLNRPTDRDDLWLQLGEISRREKDRKLEISKREKDKKKQENKKRRGIIITLIIVILTVGIITSLKIPNVGASLAAFIAVFFPILYDQLKPR